MLFNPKNVVEATEVTDRTLIYLAEKGVIGVAVEPQGRGTSRQYSKFNVFQILLVRALRRSGIEFGRIKNYLQEHEKRIWELMRGDEDEYVIKVEHAEIRINLTNLRESFDRAMEMLK